MIGSVSTLIIPVRIHFLLLITLDFSLENAFSQSMRLNTFQIESLGKRIINELGDNKVLTFREGKEEAIRRAIELITEDYDVEKDLEAEVHKALDKLEAQGTDGFDRHKMFKMMKQKLAEEKRMVL
jgi:hypothetical protein